MPVYLGDHAHLKTLLPHPKAAIHIGDYNGNYTTLVNYLQYLSNNETAYEEHRSWRYNFSFQRNIAKSPLMERSWFCRVCDWAARVGPELSAANLGQLNKCSDPSHAGAGGTVSSPGDNIKNYEGKAVKGQSREIFLVSNGTLRAIPNFDTFVSMKLDWKTVLTILDDVLKSWPTGTPMPSLSV